MKVSFQEQVLLRLPAKFRVLSDHHPTLTPQTNCAAKGITGLKREPEIVDGGFLVHCVEQITATIPTGQSLETLREIVGP